AGFSILRAQDSVTVCASMCSKDGDCYFEKAMYSLHGYEYSDRDRLACLDPEYKKETDALPQLARTINGVRDLESAVKDPIRTHLTKRDLLFELAAAKTYLSQVYFETNDLQSAERSMTEASDIYLSLADLNKNEKNAGTLIPKIVAGLLRCSKPVAALKVLSQLPGDSADRAYLTAEIYFSLGDRKLAAKAYEDWITLGCSDQLFMSLYDAYGQRWMLMYKKSNKKQSLCRQLPLELRTRVEALRMQFGHPNNIPVQGDPAKLFPALRL
ncbi:MAG: hypothetical protein KF756_05895, partial [Acidobacteria bacterium]|nr:hypothetical protein [Acidobacteriota bacterium]